MGRMLEAVGEVKEAAIAGYISHKRLFDAYFLVNLLFYLLSATLFLRFVTSLYIVIWAAINLEMRIGVKRVEREVLESIQ